MTYSDPDGDPVNCNATGLLQGETFTAENGVWKWTFSRADGPMTRSINITAYSTGGSDTATATATVLNVAPYVHDLVVLPTVIDEGGSVTLTGQITDPGADTFTLYFSWRCRRAEGGRATARRGPSCPGNISGHIGRASGSSG